MVSPELLRRYPFFGFLDDTQLKAVAMLAGEVAYKKGEDIVHVGNPAEALYFLLEGSVELYYTVQEPRNPASARDFYIMDINPGEIFGISAMLEPPIYTGTVRASAACRVLKLPAPGLRALAEVDSKMACGLMGAIAKAAMERLHDTRVQLAAARVEAKP
jgi:CRP-like cAMP-binding protein